jgi:hypothetical protein
VPVVRLPPVAEEGQKLPKDKDWWRDEDLGRVDESTEGFPLPPKYVLEEEQYLPTMYTEATQYVHCMLLRVRLQHACCARCQC